MIKKTRLYLCILLSILSIIPVQKVFALGNPFYSSNDILFYDESDSGCTGGGSGVLVGNDNKEKTLRFLIGKGLTIEQAAGVAGNFEKESGFNPASIQKISSDPHPANATENYTIEANRGFGLAQWTSSGRQQKLVNYVNSDPAKRSIIDLSLQLDFLWKELSEDYNGTLTNLKTKSNTSDSTVAFHDGYEKSADVTLDTRKTFAENIYNEYKNKITNTSVGGSGSSSCNGSGEASTFINGFAIYNQNDPQWNNTSYGSSTVGAAGCGPSSMAMVVTALTGNRVTPIDTVKYGVYVDGQGSSWQTIQNIAGHYGLKTKQLGSGGGVTVDQINTILRSGSLVVTVGTGAAPYTTSGHFFVIRAVAEDGKWLVGDSNGKSGIENSNKEWEPLSILANSSGLWEISK